MKKSSDLLKLKHPIYTKTDDNGKKKKVRTRDRGQKNANKTA